MKNTTIAQDERKHMTLRQLITAVEAYKAGMNGEQNTADKTAVVLASYDDGALKIEVYSDGTVTARKSHRSTRFNLVCCTDYTYHHVAEKDKVTAAHINTETLLDERWEISVLMKAEDRLWKNSCGYERSHSWRF